MNKTIYIHKLEFEITENHIKDEYGGYVMIGWEDPLMKAHADVISYEGADILEFGFGMGISANYIQLHNPKSHTICECHPQVIEKLKEWAKDKPSVIIIEGYWINNVDKFEKYDGIFFDTHYDNHEKYFFENYEKWMKPNAKMTFFNPKNYRRVKNYYKDSDNIKYQIIKTDKSDIINDPEYQSFDDEYYVPIVTQSNY